MTKRRNKARKDSPEALAAILPDELRQFHSFTHEGDFAAHRTAVADWLNDQVPGMAGHLPGLVMEAAGLSVAYWYRTALGGSGGR